MSSGKTKGSDGNKQEPYNCKASIIKVSEGNKVYYKVRVGPN